VGAWNNGEVRVSRDDHRSLVNGYRRALRFLAPYWGRLVFILLAGVAATSFSLVQPYVSKLLIDDALLKRDFHTLSVVSGLMVLATGIARLSVEKVAALA
jgi:ATP-binding cassette subfamily B protein